MRKFKVNDVVIIKGFSKKRWPFKPEAVKRIEVGSLAVVRYIDSDGVVTVKAEISSDGPYAEAFENNERIQWFFEPSDLIYLDTLDEA